MQIFVYIVFLVFLAILLLLGLYFISSINYRKYKNKMIDHKKNEILSKLVFIMEGKNFKSDKSIKSIKKDLKDKRGIQAFYLAYKEYVEQFDYSEDLRLLLEEVIDHKQLLNNKLIDDNYSLSYTLNLLGELNIDKDEVSSFAIKHISSKSLYVRNSALKVIRNQSNSNYVTKVLEKIDQFKKYFNYKIIVDTLDNFKGSQSDLNKSIISKIDSYNESLISIIIDHFINQETEETIVKDKMLDFLINASDSAIVLKATRYFSKVYDKRAKPFIKDNLESDIWSIRVVSVSSIVKYVDESIIRILSKRVQDVNYFVRKNSAEVLTKVLSKKELFKLTYTIKDKYAKDILIYTMQANDIKGYEKFKNMLEGER